LPRGLAAQVSPLAICVLSAAPIVVVVPRSGGVTGIIVRNNTSFDHGHRIGTICVPLVLHFIHHLAHKMDTQASAVSFGQRCSELRRRCLGGVKGLSGLSDRDNQVGPSALAEQRYLLVGIEVASMLYRVLACLVRCQLHGERGIWVQIQLVCDVFDEVSHLAQAGLTGIKGQFPLLPFSCHLVLARPGRMGPPLSAESRTLPSRAEASARMMILEAAYSQRLVIIDLEERG